ncbi:uncharacterized protein [Nicotiana tomentosiformis]|uniref:uncharacterized protein n=1 Tax=Nicotiana tomentosiformis TaxID=4098 RepID=UPI00388C7D08
MGIVETNGVDFTVFQMTDSGKRWWRDYTLTRLVGSPAFTLEQVSQLFLEKFLPITLREDFRKQFEHLPQGSMTVTEYESRFMYLACHALLLLHTKGERVRRFIEVLTHPIRLQMAKETRSEISFQVVANVARRIEMVLTQREDKGLIRGLVSSVVSVVPRLEAKPLFSAHSAPISAPPLQSYYSDYLAHSG